MKLKAAIITAIVYLNALNLLWAILCYGAWEILSPYELLLKSIVFNGPERVLFALCFTGLSYLICESSYSHFKNRWH